MLSPSEQDNLTVWRPGRKGFYEVYYLKLNDPASSLALWVRYTILAPQVPRDPAAPVRAELWAIAFDHSNPDRHAAAKSTHRLADLDIGTERFHIQIGEARLDQGSVAGSVKGPDGEVGWDLRFEPNEVGLRHFPHQFMYRGPLPKTKVLSPNVDVRFTGEVRVNGATFRLEGAPGMQAHLYGTRHAESWTWAHVNAWDDGSAAWVEGLTARIGLGPVPIPPLTLWVVQLDDRRLFFNRLRDLRKNRSNPHEPSWTFACEGANIRLRGEVSAPSDRFVGVRYEDPDGSYRFCRNTKVAQAKLQLYERKDSSCPWEHTRTLTTSHGAALEFVSRQEHPAVRTRI